MYRYTPSSRCAHVALSTGTKTRCAITDEDLTDAQQSYMYTALPTACNLLSDCSEAVTSLQRGLLMQSKQSSGMMKSFFSFYHLIKSRLAKSYKEINLKLLPDAT